jgi:Beta protein
VYEEREGGHFNFSASIRYTASEDWVIMRGEGVLNEDGAGYAQFPAQAQLLLCRPDFCGAPFSDGDLYIHNMAQQSAKNGTAKDWLAAGFNHHLTFVVRQLDGYFAGSSNSAPSSESNPSQHTLQA